MILHDRLKPKNVKSFVTIDRALQSQHDDVDRTSRHDHKLQKVFWRYRSRASGSQRDVDMHIVLMYGQQSIVRYQISHAARIT